MAISSIHIETAKPSALLHNERVFSPDYLVINDKSVNENKSYADIHISELENLAKEDYQKYSKNNRKLPSNATLVKEAIINLEKHHTLNDLEKVKDTLEKEYGYLITNMSIHRDEGYIETEKKSFIMGRNQFKNLEETPYIAELDTKDNKFYEWVKNENQEWIKLDEIKDYKINYNYHGHIVILNYDFSKHGTIRNNLKELSRMQTLVANDLRMERGKCSSTVEAKKIGVQVQESRKRVKIKEYKVQKRKEKELEKALENEKNKNIKLEKELYNFRETQKEITALTQLSVEDRKALHQLNTMCKQNKITPSELKEQIKKLVNSDNIQKKELSEKDEKIKELTNLAYSDTLYTKSKNRVPYKVLNDDKKKTLKEKDEKIKEKDEKIEELENKINEIDEAINKIDEMQIQINNLKNVIEKQIEIIDQKNKKIEELENQNETLQEQINTLTIENLDLKEKNNSSSNMSDYKLKYFIEVGKNEELEKMNEKLKNENSFLKSKITKIIKIANEKIKDFFKFKIYNDVIFKSSDDHLILDDWEDRCNDKYKLETEYNRLIENELIKEKDFEKEEDTNKINLSVLEKLNKNLDEFISPKKKKEDIEQLNNFDSFLNR